MFIQVAFATDYKFNLNKIAEEQGFIYDSKLQKYIPELPQESPFLQEDNFIMF